MNSIQTVTVPMESLAEVIVLQLGNGGRANLTVTGCSMLPMLRHRRDSVVLIPPDGHQKKGDIILYRRENGRYILHRIIAVSNDGYICSGDNQAMREPVTQEQIVGVVDGFTRKGKAYSMNAFGYRLYRAAWVELFFLRRCYLILRRRLGRLHRKYRKKQKVQIDV